MHAALAVEAGGIYDGFVLCSLLNGPFGSLEHERAVIGYFQGTLHTDNGISFPKDNS